MKERLIVLLIEVLVATIVVIGGFTLRWVMQPILPYIPLPEPWAMLLLILCATLVIRASRVAKDKLARRNPQ